MNGVHTYLNKSFQLLARLFLISLASLNLVVCREYIARLCINTRVEPCVRLAQRG